ncbi:hypothetical protein [Actinacidiphila epipremni]|nr:hypothetical protein [Actinacidiphila epipremni]
MPSGLCVRAWRCPARGGIDRPALFGGHLLTLRAVEPYQPIG